MQVLAGDRSPAEYRFCAMASLSRGWTASAEMLAILSHQGGARGGMTPTLYRRAHARRGPRDGCYRTMFIPACSFCRFSRSVTKRVAGVTPLSSASRTGRGTPPQLNGALARLGVRAAVALCGGQGCVPLMGPPCSSTRPRCPTASNRCSTSGCAGEVFKEGLLVQTQLRTHRLRWSTDTSLP